jgi:hypothetical protein
MQHAHGPVAQTGSGCGQTFFASREGDTAVKRALRGTHALGVGGVVISPILIILLILLFLFFFSSFFFLSFRYAKYRETLLGALTVLRSIDFHPVAESARPQSVEVITARKLKSGHISAQERKHIIKVHKLLLALEGSTELLASSDEEQEGETEEEEGDEDEEEEGDGEEDEAGAEGSNGGRVGDNLLSPGNQKAYPDMSKTDSLNVFAKVIGCEVGVICTGQIC